MAEETAGAGQSWAGQARDYVTGSMEELKKVQRPTRQEAMQATLVTIALVVFVALVVSLFDLIFSQIMLAVMS